jgi:ribosomal RNA assembly protein
MVLRRDMVRKKKIKQEEEKEAPEEDIMPANETVDESDAEIDVSGPITAGFAAGEYSHTIKIPKDRIAVLIGVKGSEKRELEEWSSAKIHVDSNEGDVVIFGKDALKLYELREIIQAIARGFSPETASLLLKPDYMLEIINLKDYGLDKPNRRVIEEITGTQLSVYGKTIGIIGECTGVTNAKRAIELLVKGSMHATVYKWLEDQRRKAKREEAGF